ncbi:MAG: hypothetical protein RLZZ397_904, partial [Pseudomonadota bacterium]
MAFFKPLVAAVALASAGLAQAEIKAVYH